jgi:hypothetical protein
LLEAKRAVAEARAQGRKMAKEVASDFLAIFVAMALEVRPVTQREIARGFKQNPRANVVEFKELAAIAHSWTEILLPYESARLSAIKVDMGEFNNEDIEPAGGALAVLEKLLDAYAQADEQERRIKAAREVVEVPTPKPEPEPALEPNPSNNLVLLRPRDPNNNS